MDCPIGISILFCSICKGSRILYSHCIDRHHETLALAALQAAPPFHSRYTHTAGDLTFAFLFDGDGHTYFAIAEPSAAVMPFLLLMRDGFRSTVNKEIAGSASSPLMKTAEAPLLRGGRGDEEEEAARGEMWIEMAAEPPGPMPPPLPMPLQKSLSAGAWMRESGRRLWWRHVKILVAVDVLLCLVLFGIWLAVCRGFQCVA